MPKRVGYLYNKMLNRDFIKQTIHKAAKGRTKRRDIAKVLRNLDDYVERTYELLTTDTYVPSIPRERDIYDVSSGKVRHIKTVSFFPDGIMQWLLVETMKPILMRGMYHWSCASVPGRGTHYAAKHIKKIMQSDRRGTRYCAELDIRHYYQHVDIDVLMRALERKIKDQRFLSLVRAILDTGAPGLAIGYYLCQWLANFYLEATDRYIRSLDGVHHMVRYMDNITLFGRSKRRLHKAVRAIGTYVRRYWRLHLKGNWQVYPTESRMVSAVGFRFDANHTILRKKTFLRLARACRKASKRQAEHRHISVKLARSILSRAGQLKHCNSHTIRETYIDPIGIRNLKEVVRHESKRRQRAA